MADDDIRIIFNLPKDLWIKVLQDTSGKYEAVLLEKIREYVKRYIKAYQDGNNP